MFLSAVNLVASNPYSVCGGIKLQQLGGVQTYTGGKTTSQLKRWSRQRRDQVVSS